MPELTRDTARLTDEASAVVGTLVDGLGRALRAFHDAVSVDECPGDWGIDETSALEAGEAVVCHGDADAHTARFLTAYGIGVDLPEQPGRLQDYRARWMGQ